MVYKITMLYKMVYRITTLYKNGVQNYDANTHTRTHTSTQACARVHTHTHIVLSLRELQEENRQTESERLALDRALHSEKATNQSHTARISRLEKDLRDLRVELEQKIEIGEEETIEEQILCHSCAYEMYTL